MTATIVSHINRQTGRYVERQDNGRWTLFSFKRPSDETYTFVARDVRERAALAWLDGDDDALNPRVRRSRTRAVTAQLTDAERRDLRALADAHPASTALAKLVAAAER